MQKEEMISEIQGHAAIQKAEDLGGEKSINGQEEDINADVLDTQIESEEPRTLTNEEEAMMGDKNKVSIQNTEKVSSHKKPR